MKPHYYTVLERNSDSENPMICTICREADTTKEELEDKLRVAITEHFATDDCRIILPDIEWPDEVPYVDETFRMVESYEEDEESTYKIRIYLTWMY